ncbi:AraC-type DNA-binding protein [Chryseobacterium ureilyticum]|uniref:AraC-type DNA-binding protein n=1 Tax=Chryseobacterium ureilyticum TaxID=373668 RepID=A0A1N7JVC8_9FLAO|nr:helix-turn-helix domain-containing protein [Chryseobacterium ureilyticum]SIS53285.1 AraC-type DNA-binding protein [Chryseobacterium ureilyticum]
MTETFKTFKPQDPVVSKYVSYYYLEIKPDNILREFECFPHFNNSISLYKSHQRVSDGTIQYEEKGIPLQIFTPIRENILHVKQAGSIHRIVVVFDPLGIHQFYRELNFNDFIRDFEFFTLSELDLLFKTDDTEALCTLLDQSLSIRYREYRNDLISEAVQYIFDTPEGLSVEDLAEKLQISRRHLTRVFKSIFGISVQKFQKIVLFRKTLQHKLSDNSDQNFTSLAHEYNFSDQAHFNKMFGNFTNHSPKQFLKKGTLLGTEDTFWHLLK